MNSNCFFFYLIGQKFNLITSLRTPVTKKNLYTQRVLSQKVIRSSADDWSLRDNQEFRDILLIGESEKDAWETDRMINESVTDDKTRCADFQLATFDRTSIKTLTRRTIMKMTKWSITRHNSLNRTCVKEY